MLKTSLLYLKCAARRNCGGSLGLTLNETPGESNSVEVSYGTLVCKKCKAQFPILAGVAILVPDVRSYLLEHVKGISKSVPLQKIPENYRKEFSCAKKEIQVEHIEEDLESERVNALYLMNHYLSAKDSKNKKWWKGIHSDVSPVIEKLILDYWDQGPFSVIEDWIKNEFKGKNTKIIELGCGVGGIYQKIASHLSFYLGVDSSFQSIILARHLNLGIEYPGDLKVPEDLLMGPVSRELKFNPESRSGVDFIVGEIQSLPVRNQFWDLSISMNAIDMLEEPMHLPEAQKRLLVEAGIAIQSGPYIWHQKVAKRLRSRLPKEIKNSASAVQYLYQKSGFAIEKSMDHVPWLFFKNIRQIELYSVHVFFAKLKSS